MADPKTLLDLPSETLVVLVAGYLAYRLAYLGRDNDHRATDVVFISLVFGLIAKSAFSVVPNFPNLPKYELGMRAFIGVAAAMIVAAIWRRWGMRMWFWMMRKVKVSASDGHPTALQSVIMDDALTLVQILVRTHSGSEFLCADVSAFEKTRTGPCYFGPDGSVALYVTDNRGPDEDDWTPVESVVGKEWGAQITIIPATEIAMVELRTK